MSRRRYCDQCRKESAEQADLAGRPAANRALARLRQAGLDPAHGGEVGKRRGRKAAAHQGEIARWKPPAEAAFDREQFVDSVAPGLRHRRIAELVEATGLSEHYCSLIRLGKRVPHARHWDALSALAKASPRL